MNNLINIMIILNDWTNNISPYNTYYTLGINKNDYNSNYLKLGRNLLFLNNFVGTSILPNNGKILGYSLYENFSIFIYNKFINSSHISNDIPYRNFFIYSEGQYLLKFKELNSFRSESYNLINHFLIKKKKSSFFLSFVINPVSIFTEFFITDYNQLITDYNQLEANYIRLEANYHELGTHYNNLETDFNSLEADYNELEANYIRLVGEAN